MINCKQVENYMCEKLRMCKIFECSKCPLNIADSGYLACNAYEMNNPTEAINIVQKWSNGHPQRTLLTEFLKSYPNVELNNCGYPTKISPCSLGVVTDIICGKPYSAKATRCQDCWNMPIEHMK